MKLCQLLKLSHAEVASQRKTITLSILAAGIPLIILLTISLVTAGVERIALHYASQPTDGAVYFVLSSTGNYLRYLKDYQGELIKDINMDDASSEQPPLEQLTEAAGLSPEQFSLIPNRYSAENDLQNFRLVNFALDDVQPYFPPFGNDPEALAAQLQTDNLAMVRLPSVQAAFDYTQALMENHTQINYAEAFSNYYGTYYNFHVENLGAKVIQISALVISAIIIIGTFVYLLDQELHNMVIYRALGASTRDLLIISLAYLLEISLMMLIYVVIVALVAAGGFSLINANYVGEFWRETYRVNSPDIWLIGWSPSMIWMIVAVLISAPVSLLLMLDQFSTKKLSQKLKRG